MSDQGSKWGINNDYAPLTDVLLGVPDITAGWMPGR